ncbi:hypothetical protein [Deinococcus humi]|uniref:ADP-ribosylation/crystallin J1 n=1 Tax=Deinococcus humi TaxID=662880 RepID=A0A7W8NEF5_9DEIO|nr:hypothetical protein [Deinococcus humi]MBB5364274.1 hypothetical protein [Deinococcus humi]GGO35336.1 hypothetical protein GCM10008949_37610 [Deinococcus humi]
MKNDWLDTLFPPNAERTVPWPPVGETVTLWRPTSLHELQLVAQTGWQNWPPRLPDQPIFYPVLNRLYAEEIARDWNAKRNDPPIGFITEFEVQAEVAIQYKVQVVGTQDRHQELWVPAEELNDFNWAIVGPIRVIGHFAGKGYTGAIDPETHLPEDF